jgi:hypothetical protein
MTLLFDETVALAIAEAARNNLGVVIDPNGPDGMDDLASALLGEPDIDRVHAFETDLAAAGIGWSDPPAKKPRLPMTFRIYDGPAESAAALMDDEPSVGMVLSERVKADPEV